MTIKTAALKISLIDDVSKPARTVAQALKDAESRLKDVNKAMAGSGATPKFQAALAKLGASKGDVEKVAAAWKDYAKSAGLAGNATAWTRTQAADVKRWEAQTISAIRAVRRERTAEARAENRASAQRRAAQTTHDEHVSRHGVGRALAGAAAGYTSAHSVGHGAVRTVEFGAERQHVITGMRNAGMKEYQIAKAREESERASRGAPNISTTDIMELYKEMRSAVQHPEEVDHHIGEVAQAASTLKGSGVTNANLTDLVKGAESLGLMNDPKRFSKFLEGQVKAMNVMGRTITTEGIYEASKYSKSAGSMLSDRFLNTALPSLIQEMHGSSAGDALSMLNKTLRGGLQHKHLPVERLNALGLLEEPNKIRRNKAGSIMGYSGKVKGDSLLTADPDRWFREIFDPAAQKSGATTLEAKNKLLSEILPSTAANLGRILLQQREAMENHAKLYENAPGLPEAVANQRRDAVANVQSLTSAINDLGAAVTSPGMERAAGVMNSLADGIRNLAEVAKEHPNAAMGVGAGAAGLGLVASGWLAYQVSTGFGLPAAATSLTGAAAALDAAAAKMSVASLGSAAPAAAGGAGVSAAAGAGGGALGGGAAGAAIELAAGAGAIGAMAAVASLVKISADAQKPGGQGQWAPATVAGSIADEQRLAEMRAGREKLAAEIEKIRSNSRLPEALDAALGNKPAELAEMTNQIAALEASLSKTSAAATTTKAAFDALNMTVSPTISPQGLDTTLASLTRIKGLMDSINGGAIAPRGGLPSLARGGNTSFRATTAAEN